MSLVVFGIPSCGTVKKARAWLNDHGVAHAFVDFRVSSPSTQQVARWVKVFGSKALRNTSGASYRALPAQKAEWTDEEWLRAFAADPMLIKRPVIERDEQPVLVGFAGTDAELAQKLR